LQTLLPTWCAKENKQNINLKRHKAHVHGVDVKRYKCDKCDYKRKQQGNFKARRANHH